MYKIYRIVDNVSGNVYIGRTKKKTLGQRMKQHRYNYKNNLGCSSKLVLKNNNWYYELIEETDDTSREKYWITNTPKCINKYKHNFSRTDWSKSAYQNNKEHYAKMYQYKKSWGGDPQWSNNLLRINVEAIFN